MASLNDLTEVPQDEWVDWLLDNGLAGSVGQAGLMVAVLATGQGDVVFEPEPTVPRAALSDGEAILAFDPDQPRDRKGRWRKQGGGLAPDDAWQWDPAVPENQAVAVALARIPQPVRDGLKKRGLKMRIRDDELIGVPGVPPGLTIDGIYYNRLNEIVPDSPEEKANARTLLVDSTAPENSIYDGKHEAAFVALHETGHAFDDLFAAGAPTETRNELWPQSSSASWRIALGQTDRSYLVGNKEYFADVFAAANGESRPFWESGYEIPKSLTDWMKTRMKEVGENG